MQYAMPILIVLALIFGAWFVLVRKAPTASVPPAGNVTSTWQPSKFYAAGARATVVDRGRPYNVIATIAGTSGTTSPSIIQGATATDGSVVWQFDAYL